MNWAQSGVEAGTLALDSLRTQKLRSALASAGIVIGIITVVLVATILVGVRNGIAGLFRELGTENVFAFHRNGDPYSPMSDRDAQRKPLEPWMAAAIAADTTSIRGVAAQIIVPSISNGQPIVARRGANESDTVLVEGATPNFFEIAGTEFRAGRPFTDVENRSAAKVAVLGSSISRALFGATSAIGQSFTLAGDTYFVVGEAAPRRGGFFGENRQDNDEVLGIFNVSYDAPHAVGSDEQRLFQALTQRAALHIENARLYEQSQELAVLEERSRLARELHDAHPDALLRQPGG